MTGDRRTGRIRMRDRTGDNSAFGHKPPMVVWRCAAQHRVLRVFLSRNGWHLLGDRLRVSPEDWLAREGAGYTVEDVQEGRVSPMNARRVQGVDRVLPLAIDTWPTDVRFEVGCRCGAAWADLSVVAEDCCRARDTRTPVKRTIG